MNRIVKLVAGMVSLGLVSLLGFVSPANAAAPDDLRVPSTSRYAVNAYHGINCTSTHWVVRITDTKSAVKSYRVNATSDFNRNFWDNYSTRAANACVNINVNSWLDPQGHPWYTTDVIAY